MHPYITSQIAAGRHQERGARDRDRERAPRWIRPFMDRVLRRRPLGQGRPALVTEQTS
jgi:hypothetical protein